MLISYLKGRCVLICSQQGGKRKVIIMQRWSILRQFLLCSSSALSTQSHRLRVGFLCIIQMFSKFRQPNDLFSSLKSQLILPLRLRRRDSEKMLPEDKEVLCLWRILFICCLFASKLRNLHIMAPTINKFLAQRWVRPSLLSLLIC